MRSTSYETLALLRRKEAKTIILSRWISQVYYHSWILGLGSTFLKTQGCIGCESATADSACTFLAFSSIQHHHSAKCLLSPAYVYSPLSHSCKSCKNEWRLKLKMICKPTHDAHAHLAANNPGSESIWMRHVPKTHIGESQLAEEWNIV